MQDLKNFQSFARYLDRSVFEGAKPLSESDRYYLFFLGLISLGGYFLFSSIFAAICYGMGEFAVFLYAHFSHEPIAAGTYAIRLMQVIVLTIMMTLFVQNAIRMGLDVWQKEGDLDSEELLSKEVSLEHSFFQRFWILLQSWTAFSWRMFFHFFHPELFVKPSIFSLPAAGILEIVAQEKEVLFDDPSFNKLEKMGIRVEKLVRDETLRLLLKHGLLMEKPIIDRLGQEIKMLVISEKADLLLKRFKLHEPGDAKPA